ncbi:MAG: hypothetical protein JJ979_03580 [Roseibium sp.]|nr:hypothetical protein [Roseibium sp.]
MNWRDHIAADEDYTVLAEYDDGSAVCMCHYAGGGNPKGAWSSLTILRIDADGTISFRDYEAKNEWYGSRAREKSRFPYAGAFQGMLEKVGLR